MSNNGLLSAKEFAEKISEGGYKIIDLMTEQENKEVGYIEGTTNFVDVYQEEQAKGLLDMNKNDKYLIYCHLGGRTAGIYNSMKLGGFEKVYQLEGGIDAWKKAGYSVLYKKS